MTTKEQQQVKAQKRAWNDSQCAYEFPIPWLLTHTELGALISERDELRSALTGLLEVMPDNYRVTVTSRVDRARKALQWECL